MSLKISKTKNAKTKDIDFDANPDKSQSLEVVISMLKNPQQTLGGVILFNQLSSKNVFDEKMYLLFTYLNDNGLTTLVEDLHLRKKDEIYQIFLFLEKILINILSTTNISAKPIGRTIAHKIIQDNLITINNMLTYPENSILYITTAINLLTIVVMQNTFLARELLLQIDCIQQNIQNLLANKAHQKDLKLRSSLIQFVLSFYIIGDLDIIKKITSKKELVGTVFLSMPYDSSNNIIIMLSTLHEKLIKKNEISKTLKIKLFGFKSLINLGFLYFWDSGKDLKIVYGSEGLPKLIEESTGIIEDELTSAVRNTVHALMTDLLSSFKNGIIFSDKLTNLSSRNMNRVITTFLQNFPTPYLFPRNKELVVQVIQACPDQLSYYLNFLQGHLEPRPTLKYNKCSSFINELYEALPAPSDLFATVLTNLREKVTENPDLNAEMAEQVLEVLLEMTIPSVLKRHFITQALLFQPFTSYWALRFLQTALRRARSTIACLQSYFAQRDHGKSCGDANVYEALTRPRVPQLGPFGRELTSKYVSRLCQIFPDLNNVMHILKTHFTDVRDLDLPILSKKYVVEFTELDISLSDLLSVSLAVILDYGEILTPAFERDLLSHKKWRQFVYYLLKTSTVVGLADAKGCTLPRTFCDSVETAIRLLDLSLCFESNLSSGLNFASSQLAVKKSHEITKLTDIILTLAFKLTIFSNKFQKFSQDTMLRDKLKDCIDRALDYVIAKIAFSNYSAIDSSLRRADLETFLNHFASVENVEMGEKVIKLVLVPTIVDTIYSGLETPKRDDITDQISYNFPLQFYRNLYGKAVKFTKNLSSRCSDENPMGPAKKKLKSMGGEKGELSVVGLEKSFDFYFTKALVNQVPNVRVEMCGFLDEEIALNQTSISAWNGGTFATLVRSLHSNASIGELEYKLGESKGKLAPWLSESHTQEFLIFILTENILLLSDENVQKFIVQNNFYVNYWIMTIDKLCSICQLPEDGTDHDTNFNSALEFSFGMLASCLSVKKDCKIELLSYSDFNSSSFFYYWTERISDFHTNPFVKRLTKLVLGLLTAHPASLLGPKMGPGLEFYQKTVGALNHLIDNYINTMLEIVTKRHKSAGELHRSADVLPLITDLISSIEVNYNLEEKIEFVKCLAPTILGGAQRVMDTLGRLAKLEPAGPAHELATHISEILPHCSVATESYGEILLKFVAFLGNHNPDLCSHAVNLCASLARDFPSANVQVDDLTELVKLHYALSLQTLEFERQAAVQNESSMFKELPAVVSWLGLCVQRATMRSAFNDESRVDDGLRRFFEAGIEKVVESECDNGLKGSETRYNSWLSLVALCNSLNPCVEHWISVNNHLAGPMSALLLKLVRVITEGNLLIPDPGNLDFNDDHHSPITQFLMKTFKIWAQPRSDRRRDGKGRRNFKEFNEKMTIFAQFFEKLIKHTQHLMAKNQSSSTPCIDKAWLSTVCSCCGTAMDALTDRASIPPSLLYRELPDYAARIIGAVREFAYELVLPQLTLIVKGEAVRDSLEGGVIKLYLTHYPYLQAFQGYRQKLENKQRKTEFLTYTNNLTQCWTGFVKCLLKYRYDSAQHLELLKLLCLEVYLPQANLPADSLSSLRVTELVLFHSNFLKCLLTNGPHHESSSEEVKLALLRLVDTLATLPNNSYAGLIKLFASSNPDQSTKRNTLVPILLAAYEPYLSPDNSMILNMLKSIGEEGVDLTPFKPFYWGSKAISHFSLLSHKAKSSLWDETHQIDEVFDTLDPSVMLESSKRFPLQRKLCASSNAFSLESQRQLREQQAIYDPCFLLPLLYFATSTENLISVQKFATSNGFAYILAALSSHDVCVRKLALAIFDNLHQHLIAAYGQKFKPKQQITFLLELMKASLTPETRLSSIVVAFLTEAFQVLTNPGHVLFKSFLRTLLAKPYIEVNGVPAFFKTFFSWTQSHENERNCLLNVIHRGMREPNDYLCLKKNGRLEILLTYYGFDLGSMGSNLSDNAFNVTLANSNQLVLKILHKAVSASNAWPHMVQDGNLLRWLTHRLSERRRPKNEKNLLLSLLYELCRPLCIDKFPISNSDLTEGVNREAREKAIQLSRESLNLLKNASVIAFDNIGLTEATCPLFITIFSRLILCCSKFNGLPSYFIAEDLNSRFFKSLIIRFYAILYKNRVLTESITSIQGIRTTFENLFDRHEATKDSNFDTPHIIYPAMFDVLEISDRVLKAEFISSKELAEVLEIMLNHLLRSNYLDQAFNSLLRPEKPNPTLSSNYACHFWYLIICLRLSRLYFLKLISDVKNNDNFAFNDTNITTLEFLFKKFNRLSSKRNLSLCSDGVKKYFTILKTELEGLIDSLPCSSDFHLLSLLKLLHISLKLLL